MEYLTPLVCAKELEIPILIAAPSMGPFDQEQEKNDLIGRCLKHAEKVFVREAISQKYLDGIGVKSEVTIDTAFYDNIVESSVFQEDKDLESFFEKHHKVVAMTLSDFSWNVPLKGKKDILEKNEDICKTFIDKLTDQGYGVLLVPQLFGNQDDMMYLAKYCKEGVFILSNEYDTYRQQYVISKCFALIGMRYHSNIFAAKAGVPFIAIGYENKMFGFMQQWGLEDYLLYVDQLSVEAMSNKWNQLVYDYDEYKYRIQQLRKRWQKRAEITINAILNVQ